MSAGYPAIKYEEAKSVMLKAVAKRLRRHPAPPEVDRVRCPTGLLFMRGDRDPTDTTLSRHVLASFAFLSLRTGEDLDFFLPGWKRTRGLEFSTVAYDRFIRAVEAASTWHPSGQTELLVLHYDYHILDGRGDFNFEEVIVLPVEQMILDKKIPSVDVLFEEILRVARSAVGSQESIVWYLSDRFAVNRAGKLIWEFLSETFAGRAAERVYRELRPYAICDLSRGQNADA